MPARLTGFAGRKELVSLPVGTAIPLFLVSELSPRLTLMRRRLCFAQARAHQSLDAKVVHYGEARGVPTDLPASANKS